MQWPWRRRLAEAIVGELEQAPVDVARHDLPPDPEWVVLTAEERVRLLRERLGIAERDCYEFELLVLEADAARPSLSQDEYQAIVGPHLREIDMCRRRRAALIQILQSLS